MKTLTLLLLLAVPFAAACGSQVLVDVPSSTGAAASNGGAGGAGGADGGTTCGALVADLTAKIAAARACTSVGTWDQCDQSAVVLDECGCHAPLNHQSAPAVAVASAASAAVTAAGCSGACDGKVCVARYNDPGFHGGCVQEGESPDVGVCKWTGGD